ncbi:gp169 [Synechococcus phage syn9]|uniref:Gp169 n=1 Tax=Synechococcus phage syn9 TaxID=382359 RepID=Q0QZ56_BPSYS|nr:gp169 [Synechococcus phage syn9]ABA47140.1 gp169 [Synechococcus phage syn9]AGH56509.1 hypothetical protein CPUG_00015 [Cyanophage Syn10]
MISKTLKILLHPVTQFNLLIVGFLIVIQGLHLQAHYTMDIDVESYVTAFCKKNIEKCEGIISDFDY